MKIFRIEVLAEDGIWYGLFSSRWVNCNWFILEKFRDKVRELHKASPWVFNDLKYRHYFKKNFIKNIDIPYDKKIRWHRKEINKKDIIWEDNNQVVIEYNENLTNTKKMV